MWLLKAVGAHDQHGKLIQARKIAKADLPEYTFALERNKTYKIGREKDCDIPFNSRRLRGHEGILEIGDWSLTEVS
jgi:hypothetical protein